MKVSFNLDCKKLNKETVKELTFYIKKILKGTIITCQGNKEKIDEMIIEMLVSHNKLYSKKNNLIPFLIEIKKVTIEK